MLKAAIIGLNVIALLTINYFFSDDVKVSQNIPTEVLAGESFLIEVTIDKGDRQGFAKWQQKLPLGFIAEPKETEGATFSFKGQEVKLIWMALPKQESFTISYEVMTDPLMEGEKEVNGKFSFIEENERKDIESPIHTITILNEIAPGEDLALEDDLQLVDSASIEIQDKTEEIGEEVAALSDTLNEDLADKATSEAENTTDKVDEKSPSPQPKGKTITSTDQVTINRKIEHLGDAKYKITLDIEKAELKDFAKVEEYLPPNFTATADQTEEGIFSFEDNVMKVLWMRLPDKNNLLVSYFIESKSDELDSAIVHGVFSYLDGEESKQVAMKGNRFKNHFYVAEEELAEIEEVTEEEPEEIADLESPEIEEEPIDEIEEIANESEIEDEKVSPTDKQLEQEITNVPDPETAVSYRVQIAAGKKEVQQDYFKKRHGISETVTTEFHNDWYKYTLGSYDIYRKARDRRNEIWGANNKINDAFVTAYNSGERITVQEALMITKQKWFK
ncbi:MAG: hypothetical protein RIC95_09120 [Vicingaceae bacterium]